ncbi:cytochrome C oxidase subunit 2a [Theileria orientalis strain Shintoku]|uniref:Cytochrome C oxidase subunit 2a n=1 Tax=Theileria orientalis strain Shintoku TaxID=869250 RepID=J7MBV0_THEOR|nr:cytochrome C oxidase subunit 2a [Theileria orientalis strain Shintoku]PVC50307.1 cytochrome C oxidase subunit 2a [Theileria orientalis]BAM38617.1 cytochrome C oxidase subunit 2a [Theileria orientalis strain Shintoku]|eukprot:XP_009688918.1 cytochrome C oxidase subunit 2a [Theileria orientalis strain Shintoku]
MASTSRLSKFIYRSSFNVLFKNNFPKGNITPQPQPGLFCSKFSQSTRFITTSRSLFSAEKGVNELKSDKSEGSVSADLSKGKHFSHISETFSQGKYKGAGLPKPVGPPDDLPSIEFGKPTGMYNFVRHQHGDPRGHLKEDGRFNEKYATDGFHWYDAYTDVPKQKRTIVNGEAMIMGVETRPMEELFGLEQTNVPLYHRRKFLTWSNHSYILRAEFCFFWIPTFIIFSLALPCYTMLYMMDEAVYTTMTVKVIGHQWYWVYEVESPPAE